MKWGLFGGTFDPIHIGHLRCATEMLETLRSQPDHLRSGVAAAAQAGRNDHAILPPRADDPPRDRGESGLFLLRCGETGATASPTRWRRWSTILDKYRLENLELYFILGQDAFHAIRTWKDWERLVLLCHFAVMTRPGYANQGLEAILTPEFASRFVYDEDAEGIPRTHGAHALFPRGHLPRRGVKQHPQKGRGGESDQLPRPRCRPPLYRQELPV